MEFATFLAQSQMQQLTLELLDKRALGIRVPEDSLLEEEILYEWGLLLTDLLLVTVHVLVVLW